MTEVSASRLRLSLLRFGWVVVVSVVAFVVAAQGLTAQATQADYDAKALVVVTAAPNGTDFLPEYGATIFGSGAVARAVAEELSLDGDPDALIPDRIYLQTAKDTILFTVHGLAGQPDDAAELANAAASAFVTELNKPGSGVGSFDLQAPARPPSESSNSRAGWLVPLLGALAGLLFGGGLVAAIMVLRRPVASVDEVAAVLGVAPLGFITAPRLGKRRFSGPIAVPGMGPLLRFVSQPDVDRVEIAAPPGAVTARRRLTLVLALALAGRRQVRLLGPESLLAAADDCLQRPEPVAELPARPNPARHNKSRTGRPAAHRPEPENLGLITVREGADLDGRLGAIPASTTVTVLVVPVGYPAGRLHRFRQELTDDDLSGFVLVRRGMQHATEISPGTAAKPSAERQQKRIQSSDAG